MQSVEKEDTVLGDYEEFVESGISTNVVAANYDTRALWVVAGLCSEAGELAGEVEKALRKKKDLDPDNMLSELGDILWFLTAATIIFGFTLDEVMEYNIEKLVERSNDGKSA